MAEPRNHARRRDEYVTTVCGRATYGARPAQARWDRQVTCRTCRETLGYRGSIMPQPALRRPWSERQRDWYEVTGRMP